MANKDEKTPPSETSETSFPFFPVAVGFLVGIAAGAAGYHFAQPQVVVAAERLQQRREVGKLMAADRERQSAAQREAEERQRTAYAAEVRQKRSAAQRDRALAQVASIQQRLARAA